MDTTPRETREVTHTSVDGSVITMTIDAKTGAILSYSVAEGAKKPQNGQQGTGNPQPNSLIVLDGEYTEETKSLSIEQMLLNTLTKNPQADVIRIKKDASNKMAKNATATEMFVKIAPFEVTNVDGRTPDSYEYASYKRSFAFLRLSNGRRYQVQVQDPKGDGTKLSDFGYLMVESVLPNRFYGFYPAIEIGQDGSFDSGGEDGIIVDNDEQVKWYKNFLDAPASVFAGSSSGLPKEQVDLINSIPDLTNRVLGLQTEIGGLPSLTSLKKELEEKFAPSASIWQSGHSSWLTEEFADIVFGTVQYRLSQGGLSAEKLSDLERTLAGQSSIIQKMNAESSVPVARIETLEAKLERIKHLLMMLAVDVAAHSGEANGFGKIVELYNAASSEEIQEVKDKLQPMGF